MTENLDRIPVRRRIGSEPFTDGEENLGFDLLGFWQWSASDLVSNTTRGVLAEYLVARALGIDVSGVRDGWAAYDLRTPSGIKVEVKSAAYLQSWHQSKPSVVSFRTPRTRAWDPDTNRLDAEAKRQADVYVFAILAHMEKSTLNPCDVSQWEFHVLPTLILNERTRSQHSITLPTLTRLSGGPVAYRDLARKVQEAVPGPGAVQQGVGPPSLQHRGLVSGQSRSHSAPRHARIERGGRHCRGSFVGRW